MRRRIINCHHVDGICRHLLKNLERSGDRRRIQERLDAKTALALERWVVGKRYCHHHGPVSEVADELGVDSDQLSHYFRHVHGKTFRQWEKELRIAEAQALLSMTDLSINAVARRVGITDRTNFNRQFVDLAGTSPAAWREQHREK